MTMALRFLGYDIADDQIGYAHSKCVQRLRRNVALPPERKS